MKSENNWNKVSQSVIITSFFERLFGYIVLYIPIMFVLALLLTVTNGFNGAFDFVPKNTIYEKFLGILLLCLPMLPLFFWEKSIRKFRRKNGFSVYGNIREELEQREIDERVAKEHKAFVNNGLVKGGESVDKSDIGYWFGLLKDGAITQEEYDKKKAELM